MDEVDIVVALEDHSFDLSVGVNIELLARTLILEVVQEMVELDVPELEKVVWSVLLVNGDVEVQLLLLLRVLLLLLPESALLAELALLRLLLSKTTLLRLLTELVLWLTELALLLAVAATNLDSTASDRGWGDHEGWSGSDVARVGCDSDESVRALWGEIPPGSASVEVVRRGKWVSVGSDSETHVDFVLCLFIRKVGWAFI